MSINPINQETTKKIFGYDDSGNPICNSRLRKKPGRRCQKKPMANGRCELHGGKQPPPGPLHPNYKTGEFSKFVPASLRGTFNDFLNNPDYLSLKNHIALSDTRLSKLIEKQEEILDRASLKQLGFFCQRMQESLANEDAMQELINLRRCAEGVIGIYEAGVNALALQREQRQEEEHAKGLRDVERKRIVEATKQLSVEDVLAAFAKVVFAIQTRVKDRETQFALAQDINRIQMEGNLPHIGREKLQEFQGTIEQIREQFQPEEPEDFPDYEEMDKANDG